MDVDRPTPKGKGKKVMLIVLLVLLIGGAWYGLNAYNGWVQEKKEFEIFLNESAVKMNNKSPFLMDKDTRFDSAEVISDKKFRYDFTLVNYGKDEIDIETFEKNVRPSILDSIKANPEMNLYKDHGVELIFHYKDKNGDFFTEFEFQAKEY